MGKGTSSGFVEAEVVDRKDCSGSCTDPSCGASLGNIAVFPDDRDKMRCSEEGCTTLQGDDFRSASLEALERKVSLVKAVDKS